MKDYGHDDEMPQHVKNSLFLLRGDFSHHQKMVIREPQKNNHIALSTNLRYLNDHPSQQIQNNTDLIMHQNGFLKHDGRSLATQ